MVLSNADMLAFQPMHPRDCSQVCQSLYLSLPPAFQVWCFLIWAQLLLGTCRSDDWQLFIVWRVVAKVLERKGCYLLGLVWVNCWFCWLFVSFGHLPNLYLWWTISCNCNNSEAVILLDEWISCNKNGLLPTKCGYIFLLKIWLGIEITERHEGVFFHYFFSIIERWEMEIVGCLQTPWLRKGKVIKMSRMRMIFLLRLILDIIDPVFYGMWFASLWNACLAAISCQFLW